MTAGGGKREPSTRQQVAATLHISEPIGHPETIGRGEGGKWEKSARGFGKGGGGKHTCGGSGGKGEFLGQSNGSTGCPPQRSPSWNKNKKSRNKKKKSKNTK